MGVEALSRENVASHLQVHIFPCLIFGTTLVQEFLNSKFGYACTTIIIDMKYLETALENDSILASIDFSKGY